MSQQFIIKLNEQGPQGARGEDGATGPTGNGINNISKTSTSGIVDTYTILYTDGNTSTFTITNGNSIDTIEKTDTTGLVDTYTITMVDGSTYTFEVTNGSSISSISKTSTAGLIDTYTVELTNGDTSTFTVTNGNGISGVSKTSTSGLTDTYTISFTNGNTTTFDVNNGKSITSITGPVSVGLVDTYTINFNDSTSTTFTVTNGEKGDTGATGATGNGISNIAKTSTSGLEDTYTITYTNGTTSTFKVINGNGISSIVKLSSTGLTDNFRINFTNGTYFDYSLDNAKSIVSIAKTFTSGLVDTYTITYNDNTTSTFLVTNGRGVSGVTLLSYVGLEKTYRMSFNDGTYFDYVITNGTGQVDWGGISGVLSQQTDLQDALVQSNGLTTGSVSSYNVMLSELIERAHSTFDLSKFTVVGSPNITDDGIASGFSGSNYLKTSTINIGNTGIFEIMVMFNYQAPTYWKYICHAISDYQLLNFAIDGNVLNFRLHNDDIELTATLTPDTNYIAQVGYDGIQYYIKLNGQIVKSTQSIAVLTNLSDILEIGCYSNQSIFAFNGSIDLKQFSITVDGVEVFSGNKTGIDTIKPDDYTVVGSPTISADGVVSDLTTTDYIYGRTAASLATANTWQIDEKFKVQSLSVNQRLYQNKKVGDEDSNAVIVQLETTGNIKIYLSNTSTGDIANGVSLNYTASLNEILDTTLKFTGSSYEFYVNGVKIWSLNSTTKVSATTDFCIFTGVTYAPSFGYQDLNSFKVYVDGNLVYQPCLKIPYTLSKTGSKIVKAIDRNRVDDMASQFGYANYHTLDEDNGNFTLPQAELYGLIGDKTLRDSYYNGVTYWELFSNRRLEQGGTCVSGVEYTLPRPFADANYTLTIPYSSKTATSFIPSATGDFIAKGMGLL